jgi:CBS domain containing-hemolysin-like protein
MTVPETKAADDLLEEMRERRVQLAEVVDEHGGTAGIVTLEDLVEGLVGPIEEETPIGEEVATAGSIQMDDDGSMVLDGLLRLDEFEEIADLRLDGETEEDVETLGGLVMKLLGRIPEVGDEATIDGRILRVEERDGLRVAAVRLLPSTPSARGEPHLE